MRALLASALAVLSFAAPAMALDPTGLWEPNNRESRYEVAYCGDNGDRLCARLIWIREDVQNERNMRYLNQYMFSNAQQVDEDVWEGTVSLEGFNIGGTLTQTSRTRMTVEACALFVLCESIRLRRVN